MESLILAHLLHSVLALAWSLDGKPAGLSMIACELTYIKIASDVRFSDGHRQSAASSAQRAPTLHRRGSGDLLAQELKAVRGNTHPNRTAIHLYLPSDAVATD